MTREIPHIDIGKGQYGGTSAVQAQYVPEGKWFQSFNMRASQGRAESVKKKGYPPGNRVNTLSLVGLDFGEAPPGGWSGMRYAKFISLGSYVLALGYDSTNQWYVSVHEDTTFGMLRRVALNISFAGSQSLASTCFGFDGTDVYAFFGGVSLRAFRITLDNAFFGVTTINPYTVVASYGQVAGYAVFKDGKIGLVSGTPFTFYDLSGGTVQGSVGPQASLGQFIGPSVINGTFAVGVQYGAFPRQATTEVYSGVTYQHSLPGQCVGADSMRGGLEIYGTVGRESGPSYAGKLVNTESSIANWFNVLNTTTIRDAFVNGSTGIGTYFNLNTCWYDNNLVVGFYSTSGPTQYIIKSDGSGETLVTSPYTDLLAIGYHKTTVFGVRSSTAYSTVLPTLLTI